MSAKLDRTRHEIDKILSESTVLHAVVGAGDLAVAKLRETRSELHARTGGFDPKQLGDQARATLRARVSTIPHDVKAAPEQVRALPERAQAVLGGAMGNAVSAYGDLASRGRILVERVRNHPETTDEQSQPAADLGDEPIIVAAEPVWGEAEAEQPTDAPTVDLVTDLPGDTALVPESSESALVDLPSDSAFAPEPSDSALVDLPSDGAFAPEPSDSALVDLPSDGAFAPEPSDGAFAAEPLSTTSTPAHDDSPDTASSGQIKKTSAKKSTASHSAAKPRTTRAKKAAPAPELAGEPSAYPTAGGESAEAASEPSDD